jgi:thioredoxin reductase
VAGIDLDQAYCGSTPGQRSYGPEGLGRGEAGGADGGQQAGEGADEDGGGQAAGPGVGGNDRGPALAVGVDRGGHGAGGDPGYRADERQGDRFGQELGADVPVGGAESAAQNYPGFPDGISGAELADRFVAQARRYGVEFLPAVSVTAVEPDGEDLVTSLSAGQQLTSHAVIVATGSVYRRLGVPGEQEMTGAGVHFCATCDGPLYRGADEVVVIGGGNSALEEGLHLSEFAQRVRVLARSGLSAAPILQKRVQSDPQFTVHTGMDIVELQGADGRFAAVVARDRDHGTTRRFPAAAVFVFIGLQPNSAFLGATVRRDAGGFLVTSPTMEPPSPACSPPATCAQDRPNSSARRSATESPHSS